MTVFHSTDPPYEIDVHVQGMKLGKKLDCHQNSFLAIQEYFDLQNFCPFRLDIQIFFGVPIPHFGLPFGTWHTAILGGP